MKKILLVNPYNPKSDHIQPPLGLGYLASCLRQNKFEVIICDAHKEKTKAGSLVKVINKENPDVVGFQLYTVNLSYVKNSLTIIKKINPKIKTVVGGPHSSALPEKIFETLGDFLDFAFVGEAEIGFPLLVKSLDFKNPNLKKIPGLVFRKNGKTYVNPPYFAANLDIFGFPAWDLLKPETYPEAQHGAFFEKFPIAPIVTTRGCPFDCSFCAGSKNTGRILKKRSVEKVIEEIKYLYGKHKIREFHIVDDNFTLDKTYAKNVLQEIIKLNLNISFAVPNGVRLDTLDAETLFLMKKAGFYLISVGVESGSDRILRLMNERFFTKQIKEKISLIKKAKLEVAGFFILGYPGENLREIKKTIKFSLSLGLLRANYFLFLPLPGTPIYDYLEKNHQISGSLLDNFSFTKPVFTGEIGRRKLKGLQREAFVRFYLLRPMVLLKNLTKIKRPRQLIFLTRRAFRWLF